MRGAAWIVGLVAILGLAGWMLWPGEPPLTETDPAAVAAPDEEGRRGETLHGSGLVPAAGPVSGEGAETRVSRDTLDAPALPSSAIHGEVFDSVSGAAVERFALRLTWLGALLEQPLTELPRHRAAALLWDRPIDYMATLGPMEWHHGGRFAVRGTAAIYVLNVQGEGYVTTRYGPFELGRGADQACRIELQRAASVRGRVLGSDVGPRRPVAGATVELWVPPEFTLATGPGPHLELLNELAAGPGTDPRTPWSSWVMLTSKSDAEGRFELRGAPAGSYFVRATHGRYAAASSKPFPLTQQEVREDIVVTLGPRGQLRGSVRSAKLPDGVRVFLFGGWDRKYTVTVDTTGHYGFSAIPPGPYFACARRDRAATWGKESVAWAWSLATVVGGKVTHLDLNLEAGGDREVPEKKK